VANGVVYAGSENGTLYAFDAANGNTLWSVSSLFSVRNSSPAVANGVVYIGDFAGTFYAFDAANGNRLWFAQTNGSIESSPAVANGVVYVGSVDSKLYAFGLSSGSAAAHRSDVLMPSLSELHPNRQLKPIQ
jgi:outer membrane protein assembly factor BamB